MEVIDIAPVPAAIAPSARLASRQHDALRIEILAYAEAVAAGAGARRVVEREQPGFQFIDTVAAFGAGKPRGKTDVVAVAVHVADRRQAIGKPQGRFKGFRPGVSPGQRAPGSDLRPPLCGAFFSNTGASSRSVTMPSILART